MAFLRQTWTLTLKNWKIIFRHAISAIFIAFILPIALTTFFSFAKNLFVPPAVYGVSDPRHIRTLPNALDAAASAGRHKVVFVNGGFSGGDIDKVIDKLAASVESAGKTTLRRTSTTELSLDCPTNLRGVSNCYGAVVFQSSPSEGPGDHWNYTLRSDGALRSIVIDVDSDKNDAQIYLLPLQRAVDEAIASVQAASGPASTSVQQGPLPSTVDEYPFTSLTQEERAVRVRINYQSAITNWMGVAFMTSVLFITYHLTGFIATERESGMIRLVDAMMPVKHRWFSQAARIISYHAAFTVVYLPGWIIGSLVLRAGVFARTNVGIVLVYHVLNGIAMASLSILASSLFKKAQISGIAAVLAIILLGILAQSISYPSTAAVGVLAFLFTPCNYVYFITWMARWEREDLPADLSKVAPKSPWDISGIILWVFLIIQIFVYPLLGAVIESSLHGTTTRGRTIVFNRAQAHSSTDEPAVRLQGFTKVYSSSPIRRLFSFISKPREPVRAVDGLTLDVRRGQILCLLGANGSGKSTTLDSIAGTSKLTSGTITIDGTGGLGIAPQKNVMWDDLTVEQHIEIFNRLKSPGRGASKQEIQDLIRSVDLETKAKAVSKSLSGGQKRKLQLGMMLTGGSAVCCVDEVSSGIDPLSRRKIWDILLAERGRRTIILTTHFLDEADLLADHIAILSKGTLRADGSSVELKDRLGGGYRVHVTKETGMGNTPDIEGVQKKIHFDLISYIAPSSSLAAQVIRTLEANNFHDYRFSGPTIEDVFLQLAEEIHDSKASEIVPDSGSDLNEKGLAGDVGATPQAGLQLLSGQQIGYMRQAAILFRKRTTILKTNWIPYLAAFVLPVAAAGLVTLFIKGQTQSGCAPSEERSLDQTQGFSLTDFTWKLVLGPSSRFDLNTAASVLLPVFNAAAGSSGNGSTSGTGTDFARQLLAENATFTDSFKAFQDTVVARRVETVPGGIWLGDDSTVPTIAYMSNYNGLLNPILSQNILNMLLSNVTVMMAWAPFATPWQPNDGNSLQFLVYTGIALACYPGFFALYPSLERRRQVRALQYSNGVRVLPLWAAYLAFDFIIVLASTALVTIIWAVSSGIWYHIGYIFLVFMLYGLTAILLAYVISLWCKTQLSTYAWVAAGQAVLFLVYLIAYMCTITYSPVPKVDRNILVAHFVISAFAPIGSVVRAMFLVLNLFSTACDGRQLAAYPGGILQYGGPILYLVLQSILLFALLLWADSGSVGSSIRRLWQRKYDGPSDDGRVADEEVTNELKRVTTTSGSDDGLRVIHLTKTFGKNTAVDNVTFGLKRSQVFALLGPNGAGKSTTISLIRGDLKPSRNGGEILVEDQSVIHNLPAARSHLGVCPQHDALDLMTVREHLEFYARIRGVPDIHHNVDTVIHAVGLQAFSNRMAAALSGGNARKLSLGIALMGSPSVILLDEPSSGLDAAAKRIMWKTLAAIVPGRSLLLTTHSMEEADALADRAGILAKRMLALGTTDDLRHRFGDALHVHLISRTAPHTTPEETAQLRNWVISTFPGADVEEKTYHGQMRFSVPGKEVLEVFGGDKVGDITPADTHSSSAVGQLAVMLEEQKGALGINHFSVSPTTLDQVFLNIVGKNNIQEEGYKEPEKKPWWRFGR
ncbi:ABC transporter [Colletotrichum scovillei]|uniref:ABC transporter n=1 Tax=Colletotrichum scovillei TaxID=1209932 RepID=A0A9P7QY50_9PEZI|nr:ABC transporter [Colletotrichum scovillei]KAF4781125.1 ABC transporter [Colletotrichum scovillei]KAG7045530.1 ABC transporter [Colletotrichum scovillei]KAG7052693.1 ABC transporter [Colletotrichum scovillei]KAG7064983.1 ABC transporter [Colletotrichum scovillei]